MPGKAKPKAEPRAREAKPIEARKGERVAVLLSGGNPQIAKADGDAPDKNTRYIDIHEGDELDERQMATWVKQAAPLPGWVPGRPS